MTEDLQLRSIGAASASFLLENVDFVVNATTRCVRDQCFCCFVAFLAHGFECRFTAAAQQLTFSLTQAAFKVCSDQVTWLLKALLCRQFVSAVDFGNKPVEFISGSGPHHPVFIAPSKLVLRFSPLLHTL